MTAAARHLAGTKLPDLALPATSGPRSICRSSGAAPSSTSIRAPACPASMLPPGWDEIPGARGCTPQSCGFRDHFAELKALGVAHVFGLSTQDTGYQREAAERLHLPFPILSDADLEFARALAPADVHDVRHDACSSAWRWSSTTA